MIAIIFLILVIMFGATALIGAPYVPSHRKQLKKLFANLYKLSPNDLLIDIGSGDGVVLKEAVSRGARALGYEINPLLVAISYARLYGQRSRSKVVLTNFWTAKFPPDTTVVYTFGESRDILKMYRKVEREAVRLNKTLFFISYGFGVKDINPHKKLDAHYLYKISPLQSD